jgi:uncharacterized UPF0160 family protein
LKRRVVITGIDPRELKAEVTEPLHLRVISLHTKALYEAFGVPRCVFLSACFFM